MEVIPVGMEEFQVLAGRRSLCSRISTREPRNVERPAVSPQQPGVKLVSTRKAGGGGN